MDSMGTSYSELVCSICLDLLAEKPGEAGIPSKRPRLENEPGPSTPRNDATPRIVTTTCGHVFHEECIKEALKIKKVCPNCQRAVSSKSLRRTFMPLTPGHCANCKKREEQVNRWHEEMRKVEGKLARETEKVEEMQVREELILQEEARLEKDLENSRIASEIQSWNQESQRKDGQLGFLQRKLMLAEMDRDSERNNSEFLQSCLQHDAPQDTQCMDKHNRQPDVISIPFRDEDATARTLENNESINYIFDSHHFHVSDYEADDESDSEMD